MIFTVIQSCTLTPLYPVYYIVKERPMGKERVGENTSLLWVSGLDMATEKRDIRFDALGSRPREDISILNKLGQPHTKIDMKQHFKV